MKYIIVSNTGSDSLSKINFDLTFNKEFKIGLNDEKLGPTGMCMDEENIYTANNYNNTVSIINKKSFKEENRILIGANPNDLICYKDYLYISVSEANLISVYNKKEKRLEFSIPTKGWPYNMEILKEKELIIASNFQNNSISVIDINTNKLIREIRTLDYPTKIKLSKDNKYIYVCESYMGAGSDGYIEIFDIDTFESLMRIKVGRSPMDIEEDEENIYVINFEEGTLSFISKETKSEFKRVKVGGMPKVIKLIGEDLAIIDYFNSKIIIFDKKSNKKRIIAIGNEPSAMMLY